LNNEVPTLDLINRISDFLEVPRPVFIAETEEEARGGSTTPSAADPPEVIIRKNMLRFREEAGYDLVHASDATEIPFDQLRSFEIGDAHPEAKHIAALAKAYGHKPGDFYELQPPKANLDDVPWIHFRVRPGFNLTEDDVAELMAVVRKIEQRFRTAKKKIAAEFQKAKGRRKPRGTDSP
jgi:transcriptional regulator with XRE-family HTH domain